MSTAPILIKWSLPHFQIVLRAPLCRATPNWFGTILISRAHHTFCRIKSINKPSIVVLPQPQCPYLFLSRNNITRPQPPPPLPPPTPALVKYIVGSGTVSLESAISSIGLHGAHRCCSTQPSLIGRYGLPHI